MPPLARSVDLTCPAITSNSRLSSHAPLIAVMMLDTPGPAVTRAKALFSEFDSLKYSAAIPAETSCTTGMQVMVLLTPSNKCMMFPPATKKQCV